MLKQLFGTKLQNLYHSDSLCGDELGELRYDNGNWYRLVRNIAATAIASAKPAIHSAALAADFLKYVKFPQTLDDVNDAVALAGVFNQMGKGEAGSRGSTVLTAIGASSIAGTSTYGDCAWICVQGLVLSATITGSVDGPGTCLIPYTLGQNFALVGTNISTGMNIHRHCLSIETYGTMTGDITVHCL